MSVFSRLMSYDQCRRVFCFSYKRYNFSVRHNGYGQNVKLVPEKCADSTGQLGYSNGFHKFPSTTNWISFCTAISVLGLTSAMSYFLVTTLLSIIKELESVKKEGVATKMELIGVLKEVEMNLWKKGAADDKKRYEQDMEVYRSRQEK